jgi:hypothetical protein
MLQWLIVALLVAAPVSYVVAECLDEPKPPTPQKREPQPINRPTVDDMRAEWKKNRPNEPFVLWKDKAPDR